MTERAHPRISPYKKLSVQVSTDVICFEGVMQDMGSGGSCIWVRTEEELPVYRDNRLLVRCRLNDLNSSWSDESLIGRVRWIQKKEGEILLGVEFLDTHEYYHPRIYSLSR